jgi:hypothetical protein
MKNMPVACLLSIRTRCVQKYKRIVSAFHSLYPDENILYKLVAFFRITGIKHDRDRHLTILSLCIKKGRGYGTRFSPIFLCFRMANDLFSKSQQWLRTVALPASGFLIHSG